MKIDEAMGIMKKAFIECIKNYTDLNVVDANVQIQNAFKDLQWYREQDLVKREDVKKVFSDYLKGHECLDDDWADFVAEKKCEQIPKAEPPIDECTPNCEKRFTCKHCIQGMYCNSETGNEDEVIEITGIKKEHDEEVIRETMDAMDCASRQVLGEDYDERYGFSWDREKDEREADE